MEFSFQILLFCLVVLIAEFVGTISGFGSSIFLVPATAIFFSYHTALALTGIIFVFSSTAKLWKFRKHIEWPLMWKMGLPSVIFTLLGAFLNARLNLQIAELTMGGFLVVFAIAFFIKGDLHFAASNRSLVAAGVVSGFLNGFIGTGGAVRGAALSAVGLSKSVFVATSAGIDLGGDIGRSVVYIANGYLDAKFYSLIPILMVLTYAGTSVGKKILDNIPEKVFKKIVLSLIGITGLLMVYDAVFGKQILT